MAIGVGRWPFDEPLLNLCQEKPAERRSRDTPIGSLFRGSEL